MHIELRKIKHAAFLSEETNAYTADLYVDGTLIAHVGNDGHGGCDHQHPAKGNTYNDIKRVDEWVKANLPAKQTAFKMPDGTDFVMEPTLEGVCGDLLEQHLMAKRLERVLKRTVAYFDPAKKAVFTFKGKLEGVQRAEAITTTLRKNPSAIILNNLPFDEALKVFSSAA